MNHKIVRSADNAIIGAIQTSVHSSSSTTLSRVEEISNECIRDFMDRLMSNQYILRLNLDVGMERPFLTDRIINSVFLPGKGAEFLLLLDSLPPNSFLLGIGYKDKEGRDADAQQAITGTFNSRLDENANGTLQRETLEEARLNISDSAIFSSEVLADKDQRWNHYKTSISSCIVPHEFGYKKALKKFDVKGKKISNSVYGTAEEMIKAFVNIAIARPTHNDDKVSYIIATPVSIVKKLVAISIRENAKGNKWTPTRHIIPGL